MDDPVGVAVINRLEKLLHVLGRLLFAERLIFLAGDLVEQRHSVDVLHNYGTCEINLGVAPLEIVSRRQF